MSGRLVLSAYEHLVELAADEDVLEMALTRLPDAFQPSRGPAERSWSVLRGEHGWLAAANGEHLGARHDADSALETALADMELWVAEHLREFVCVHAGCVAREGQAIILPGRTFAGKTSIVEVLCRMGADYYSDEFALIDCEGLVQPYPRPLSRRQGQLSGARLHPSKLGLTIGASAARVALVALLRFDPSAGWDVEPLSRARTIMGLLENTVPAQSRPRESLTAAENATRDARGLLGTRGEAEEAAAILLDLLSAP
jgi:hypothetical protein